MSLSVLGTRSAAIRLLTIMVLSGPLALGTASSASAADDELKLKYHLYSFGLKVATLNFDINVRGKSYKARTKMKTKGLVNFIKSTAFTATASGRLAKNGLQPRSFKVTTKSSKKGERKAAITWNKKRIPSIERSYHRDDYKVAAVAEKIRPNMPDPLTALLSATFQTSESLCRDNYRILDGKTIYDIKYRLVNKDNFGDDDAGVYRGAAFKCEITYRPVAGLSRKKWAKLKAQKNKGVQTFIVWMAPVKSAASAASYFVPVGAVAQLGRNKVYAYLMRASLSGQPLNERSKVAKR
ncbi:MAG: DUF3108 domain-containing protein [Hyphomicrobiales bacterium]